jgi:hypothetical protein
MSVTILAKRHLAQNATLVAQVPARFARNATWPVKARQAGRWQQAGRCEDAGSADQQTADGADGAERPPKKPPGWATHVSDAGFK